MRLGLWENYTEYHFTGVHVNFRNIWTIKTTPQFRSIEQDRYNLCIEQCKKKNHVDVKITNIPQHIKEFDCPLFCSRDSVFGDAIQANLSCELQTKVFIRIGNRDRLDHFHSTISLRLLDCPYFCL